MCCDYNEMTLRDLLIKLPDNTKYVIKCDMTGTNEVTYQPQIEISMNEIKIYGLEFINVESMEVSPEGVLIIFINTEQYLKYGSYKPKILLKDILPYILNHTSSGQLNSKDAGCYRILIPGDNTRWIETNDRGKPICMFCGHPEEGKDPYKILSNYRNTRVTSIECIRDKYIEHGNQLFVEIQLESPVELIKW